VLIDDTVGRRVPDGDAEAFARAVNELMSRHDRRVMGERARQLVVGRFGIDRLVTDIAALYRSLISAAI
jgi:glycosyltransferase involved in cell wall biosynthesis